MQVSTDSVNSVILVDTSPETKLEDMQQQIIKMLRTYLNFACKEARIKGFS